MDKTCLIYQPAGIGDVFFCQTIAKHYVNLGYQVIYPVKSNLIFLKDYLVYGGITIVDESGDFPYKEHYNQGGGSIMSGDFIYLNLDQSHRQGGSGGYMLSKYSMVGLDYKTWIDGFIINRNKEREEWLFNHLNIKDGERYILMNTKYGTPPAFAEYPVPKLETNDRVINMDFIEGTNILDWVKVLEKASGIVTVDTCIQYIMDILTLDYDFYHCYLRDGGRSGHLNIIKNIFTKPWEYKI